MRSHVELDIEVSTSKTASTILARIEVSSPTAFEDLEHIHKKVVVTFLTANILLVCSMWFLFSIFVHIFLAPYHSVDLSTDLTAVMDNANVLMWSCGHHALLFRTGELVT